MLKICCTLFAFGFLTLPALADDPGTATTAEVKITVVFPANLDSFDGHSIKVFLSLSRLRKPYPRTPAQRTVVTTYLPVDTQQVDNVSHMKGTESKQVVTVGSKIKLEPSLKYLASAQVLSDNKFKGSGMLNSKPTVPVLTGGAPSEVTLTVLHLNK